MDLPTVEETGENDPTLKVVLKGHKKSITDISFHPCAQNQFTTSSEDGTLMVWNIANNSRNYNYIGHSNSVTGVEYSPDGKILASCSFDRTIRFWTPSIKGDCSEIRAHLMPINSLDFSADGMKLITGARDKAIKMWDVSSQRFLSTFLGHNHWIRSVKFLPNGKSVVSAADDKSVRIWDVLTGKCIHAFTGQEGSPVHVAPYPNNNSIAVAMSSGTVRIYELRTRKVQQHYVLHTETTYVSWHPYDNYLLTCGKEGNVRIVDVMEGRPIYTIKGHVDGVTCANFSPDGEHFVTGGSESYVMVWKTNFIKDA